MLENLTENAKINHAQRSGAVFKAVRSACLCLQLQSNMVGGREMRAEMRPSHQAF